MKTSTAHGELQLWAAVPEIGTIVRPEHLAVARFELIERAGAAAGWLDLTFAHGPRTGVLPGVIVDLPLALRGDPAAFTWPRAAAAFLDLDAADRLAELLRPPFARWLGARVVPSEAIETWVACPAFADARAAGDVGAAPLAGVLVRTAPWVYAARFAGDGPASVEAADAALGLAVLRRFNVPAAGACDARAAAWYGVDSIPGPHAGGALELALTDPCAPDWYAVRLAPPVPMDVAFAFELGDASAVRRFWVRGPDTVAVSPPAPTPPTRRPRVPLAFVVRGDLERTPDADSDELAALTAFAGAVGVASSRVAYERAAGFESGAMPVVLGDVRDPAFASALETLARRGGPFIAWLQPIGEYPDWHESALDAALRGPIDDAYLTNVVRAYDLRTLVVGDVPPQEPPAAQAQRARIAAALAVAAAVVLPATQSLFLLSRDYGARGRPLLPIPPIVPPVAAVRAAGARARAPFVFVHGPAESRSGILCAAVALRDLRIPALIALDGGDPSYVSAVRAMAGMRTTIVANAPPPSVARFVRDAALYLDPSLRPRGLTRLVGAARAGALPVVFADSPLAPLLDPATVVPRRGVADLRDALTLLWDSPLRANQARAAALALGTLDRTDVAVRELFNAICDLTGA